MQPRDSSYKLNEICIYSTDFQNSSGTELEWEDKELMSLIGVSVHLCC